jgi:hypothetical protein
MTRRLFTSMVIAVLWFGLVGVVPASSGVAGGVDGFGVVDVSSGQWYLRDPGSGATTSFYFGDPGDYPMMGDWDCDGVATPGLYRQSDGFVYLRNSNTQGVADSEFFFGNPGDVPLAGDFNGDGCDTVSVFRPSESRVFVINVLGADDGGLGAAEFDYVFGNPGDAPFVGDFDGDGTDTVGLHRVSTGLVYFRNSHTQGDADAQFVFGDPGDLIMAGAWTGSHTFDTVGIFRPSEGVVYLNHVNAAGPADQEHPYGNKRMVPVSGHFGTLPGEDQLPPAALTVITDSVVLGAERYFPDAFPGWEIDFLGKPAVMLHQIEDVFLYPGRRVNRYVVLAIGYNSLWEKDRLNYESKWAPRFDRQAEEVLDFVRSRGAKQIAWVTLREASPEAIITPQQIDQNTRWGWYMYYVNERLHLLDSAHDDLVLADWAAASRGPGNTYDLIHLNRTGAQLMVKTIAAAIESTR